MFEKWLGRCERKGLYKRYFQEELKMESIKEFLKRLFGWDGEDEVLVQNVPSKELDDRSFIEYWQNHIHFNFSMQDYLCPATRDLYKIQDLDGAHVKKVNSDDKTIYIVAVSKSYNRSRTRKPFMVKKKYLVKAPKQKADK